MNAQNVNALLDALGQRFGATGAHLWAVLIRQAYVEATMALVAAALVAAAGLWMVKRSERLKAGNQYFDWFDDMPLFGGSIFLFIAALAAIIGVLSTVGAFINPEYYALAIILHALSTK